MTTKYMPDISPAFVFVHGAWDSAGTWHKLIPPLEASRSLKTICLRRIDRRGAGATDSRYSLSPYLGGERAPFSDPFARAAFIGMSRTAERAEYRAALEGVACAYAHALDALLPERPKSFVLTGG